MNLAQILRKETSAVDYVERLTPIPGSSKYCTDGFRLVIPDEVQSPREKVAYALWNIGELPYHELLLYTDLARTELDSALKRLINKNVVAIVSPRLALLGLESEYFSASFKLEK